MADRIGQSHLQLTSSGTAALEIVLRAASIGAGDEVLLSSYDYPGNFWAIERVGARPVLLDTSVDSWRIDSESLERAYLPACKAVVVSHLHGELQKVDELRAWCDYRKVLLLEDICQSLGAYWKGSPVGSYGHAAILSFGGGKLLSCGRGGAWATSDETLAIKARVAAGAGSGPYALSELQAATVLAQLPWLDEINANCREYFGALDRQLKVNQCDWKFVPTSVLDSTAFYQCGWQLNERISDEGRQQLLMALHSNPQINEGAVVELPVGVGFSGFHRRSNRRCRISGAVGRATAAARRTLVLHHRVVLQQQWTPVELADWITFCIAGIR
jgi:dTDP-4-amino-4,6-dideoxygalactose transaminase